MSGTYRWEISKSRGNGLVEIKKGIDMNKGSGGMGQVRNKRRVVSRDFREGST